MFGKPEPRCPYMYLHERTLPHKALPGPQDAQQPHRTTGFLCDDGHSSPAADCRSDDLPFHITPRERREHDIAPKHADGEPNRPTDMDADDVYNIGGKPCDMSDANAVTQHIYSSHRLWKTEIPPSPD